MNHQRLEELFELYLKKNSSVAEREELFALIKEPGSSEILLKLSEKYAVPDQPLKLLKNESAEEILNAILKVKESSSPVSKTVPFFRRTWLRYAAAIIVVAGAGSYIWLKTDSQRTQSAYTKVGKFHKTDIAPGGNKAVLQLADGRKIVLDSASTGMLAHQGKMKIIMSEHGQLAYQPSGDETAKGYNTISTPRGGQYQIGLPDGSKVWLNAESSVKFPMDFNRDRTIEVTGEAYFEIAPLKNSPFFVNAKGTSVQVLGTSFNINAYEDDNAIKTTLVDGSINIINGNDRKQLQPGQQALTTSGTPTGIQLQDADMEQTLAWKNGMFNFKKDDIESVMKQIERWYDVKVVFSNKSKFHFTGKLPRQSNVSYLLRTMALTEAVHFKIEDDTIIVE